AGQPRDGRGDLDPRPRRADRRADRVRRRDRLGQLDAERPAAAQARHVPGRTALRLPRAYVAPRWAAPHHRLVPRARRDRGVALRIAFVYPNPRADLVRRVAAGDAPDT